MKTIVYVLVVVGALVGGQATGQTLFKCKGPNGVSSYQQTACPDAKQDAGVVKYERQPDAPHWQANPRRPLRTNSMEPRPGAPAQQTYAQPAPRTPSINPMSADSELARRREHLAGSREGRAQLRAMEGTSLPQQTTQVQSQPRTLTDQNGNTFTQPPGSAFATDNKTGKQCFVNGGFIQC